jgi:site-specific recombinase XerD
MLNRYQKIGGIESFGLQDLKAKGATDMYKAGVPIEIICELLGHSSVTTTEIYIKQHMVTIAVTNQLSKKNSASPEKI